MERLMRTQILCGDALRAIRATDTPDCLHYLDPPYVASTRRAGGYTHEMTDDHHRELIELLTSGEVEGKVVLSGYEHEIYAPLQEAGWAVVRREVACHAVGRTRGTGLLGAGATQNGQRRIECLYLCPRTADELDLQK